MVKYLCIAVIAGFVLAGCGRKLDTFQQMVQELDEAEKDIRSRQDEIRTMIQEYNAAHPDAQKIDASSIETMVMKPEEVETLNQMLANEQDVSYKGLVTEIVESHNQIRALQDRVRQVQQELPAPYTVQVGDTHSGVSINYLMENHGLSRQEAGNVVEKTALVEELYVGFQIWMLYKDGMFGTYVTQGTAPVSPGRAQQQAKQRIARKIDVITGERDYARVQADSLQELHDTLQERIVFLRNEENRLQMDIASLQASRDEAMVRVEMSEQQRKALETQLNSIYYEVDTLDGWKRKKVIADPLFGSPRVRSLATVQFSQSQDLRENNMVMFDSRSFPELRQIKRIDVFPRSFKEGEEYVVSVEGDRAYFKILKPDAFAGQKVIFALR